ncbi:MAG: phosphatidylserine/phosphatidylglycerophosphate/cardiolipin synthase family protein, partial [Clostridia bacterium]|nr:phosphatidylserine/phosphatidylglycerophosphate/cardiolipin synthase family protein [Clostridia bacterium]
MNDNILNSISLLTDGKEAFPEILKCIDDAKKNIEINMFIWRGDNIGKAIAQAVLNAADRGVNVFISVDRYGFVLEKCEECTHSFFHKRQTLIEAIKINTLKLLYPTLADKNPPEADHELLLEKLLSHPNIVISKDIFKADHSKYYIFDEKILILGGINIEDKENGQDISGRRYRDYMVKISSAETVK